MWKKISIKVILLISIFFITCFWFYSHKLIQSTSFIGDFARDLYDILTISKGDIRLIGPKLSFGGIYAAPWYYYLFVPVYVIFGRKIEAILYFNVFLHTSVLLLIYLFLQKKQGNLKSLLITISIAFLPLFIFSARNPGNAFTYQPFLILWFVYYSTKSQYTNKDALFSGLWAGLIASFHIITSLIFIPAWFYLFIFHKKFKQALISLLAFVLPFAPLVLFELTHGLVMIKNTLVDKSYQMFTQNLNIPDRTSSPKNVWQNLVFINQQLTSWVVFGPLVYLLSGVILSWHKKKNLWLVGWGIIIYILFAILSRYQFAIHYLLPLGLSIYILCLLSLIKHRLLNIIISLIILIELVLIIKTPPIKSMQNFYTIQDLTFKVIASEKFSKNNFNVVYIEKGGRSTIGQQFRYFFEINNHQPDSEYEFSNSKQLIVFTENQWSKKNLLKLDNYEIRQFGNEYINQSAQIKLNSSLTAYILNK
jgi:hypothetical protein